MLVVARFGSVVLSERRREGRLWAAEVAVYCERLKEKRERERCSFTQKGEATRGVVRLQNREVSDKALRARQQARQDKDHTKQEEVKRTSLAKRRKHDGECEQ